MRLLSRRNYEDDIQNNTYGAAYGGVQDWLKVIWQGTVRCELVLVAHNVIFADATMAILLEFLTKTIIKFNIRKNFTYC